jgi:hemerythrin
LTVVADLRGPCEVEACLTVPAFDFLKNWLVHHIQGSDRTFSTWLTTRAVATN